MLSIPPTATISVSQSIAVSAIDYDNYTERSASSPLAQVSIVCDVLTELEWTILRSELIAAKGVIPIQLPFIGGSRQFLVLEFEQKPLLYGQCTEINFTAIEQRDRLVALPIDIPTIVYPCWYDSNSTTTFKVLRTQFNGGFQSAQSQGSVRISVDSWNVVFHLSLAEATALDQLLMGLRGIYPFYWYWAGELFDPLTGRPQVLEVDAQTRLQWLCDRWQIDYDSTDFCIFTGLFVTYNDSLDYVIVAGSLLLPVSVLDSDLAIAAQLVSSVWGTSIITTGAPV